MVSGRVGCWSALPLPRRLDPSEASSKPLGLSLQNGLAPRGPQPWSGGRTSAPQSSSPARSPAGSEEPPWCLSGGRLQQLARRRAGRLASKPGFASLNIILVLGTRGGPTVPPYALLGGKTLLRVEGGRGDAPPAWLSVSASQPGFLPNSAL